MANRQLKTRKVFHKTITLLLLVGMNFSPVVQVFAQTSSDTSPADTQSSSTDQNSLPTDNSTPPTGDSIPSDTSDQSDSTDSTPSSEDTTPPDQPDSLLSGSDSTSPTIDNPQLFTAQSLAPRVDQTTGALVQRVAFDIPPGRNGLTPDLALVYNSQQLDDGQAGYGWTLSIPYIERLNKTGVDRLYVDNYFTSSVGGELATTTTSNEYRLRIDDGTYLKFVYSGGFWTAYDKNGTSYKYGSTTAAQQYATSTPSNVSRWMLEEVRDTNNNYISYTYQRDNNQIYPSKITYSGNATTTGVLTIDIATSTRPDPITSYKSGYKVVTNYRISDIKASINGSWVRDYALSYSAGVNGTRSLLSSVLETGRDSAGTQLSLPALTFTYSSSTPTYTSHTNREIKNSATVAADSDGNGLPDFNIFYENIDLSTHSNVSLNTYPAFNDYVITPAPDYWAWSGSYVPWERGVRYFDANGDGKADAVTGLETINSGGGISTSSVRAYYENGGMSWTGKDIATGTIPIFGLAQIGAFGSTYSSTGIFGNINGDNLTDYVISIPPVSFSDIVNGTFLHVASTTGWAIATSTFTPVATLPTNPNDTSQQELVDINGDGLDDWMTSSGGTTQFCLNTGTGWDTSCTSGWTIATSTRGLNGWDRGIRFMDINGDGLPDYVRAYIMPTYSGTNGSPAIEIGTYNYVYLNTGSGWATSTIQLPEYIFTGTVCGAGWCGDPTYNEYIDWNGDGIPDAKGSTSINIKPDLLAQVTYPTGGGITANYAFSAQSQTGSNPDLAFPQLVVTDLETKDGLGQISTTTYSYDGGKMYLAGSIFDRRFAGFSTITETKPNTITVTYFNQGDATSSVTGELTDSFAQIGKPFRVDVKTSTSSLMQQTFYRYDTADLGGRYFVSKTSSIQEDFDGNGTHKDSAQSFTYSTTTGNVTQKINWGEVTGGTGTYTDTGTDKFTIDLTYAASSTNPVSLLADETLSDQSATKVSEKRHYYDGLSLNSIASGNETKTETWKSASSYASTTKSYNSYGLVTQQVDGRGGTTTYTYDTFNLYVSTTTNALSHVTGTVYDYANGKVTYTIDPNNRAYQTLYDPVGRVKEIKQPDLTTPTTFVTKTTIGYADNTLPTLVHQTNYINAATSTNSYNYYDGLGRLVQERKTAEGSNYTVHDLSYNLLGMLSSESLPYFGSGASTTAATTSSSILIKYGYDALNRIASTTNNLGSTAVSYDDWKTTTVDPLGKIKDLTKDAYGNLARVDEHFSTTTYTSLYAWDGLKDLTKITDALNNVRNFTYDGLGRQLTSQDIHASADTSFATTTYSYDDANNLTQKVDSKSQTTNYTYDSLNRVTAEDYTGSGGTEITYAYDSCADGKTRLCAATTTDAATSLTYNANGSVSSETKTINGVAYTTSYNYDRQGNITDITYPDTSIVHYGYDSVGLLETISRKAPNSSTYVAAISELQYAPNGAISLKRFGNGVVSTYTYDPLQLYRLTNILTVASSTIVGGGGSSGALGLIAPKGSHYATASNQDTDIALADAQSYAAATFSESGSSIVPTLASAVDQLLAVATVDTSLNKKIAPQPVSSDVYIDGKIVSFTNTDDNTGEDLIISTDKTTYSGLSEAPVYFMVENTSGVAQNIDLNFYFSDFNKGISDIERLNVVQGTVSTPNKTCTSVVVASSTSESTLTTCADAAPVKTRTVLYADGAPRLLITTQTPDIDLTQALTKGGKERKSISEYVSNKTGPDVLQVGERAYYKATIKFDPKSSGKFYIEAVGSKGAYGHLDPWFSSSWTYRKKVTLSGSSGAGTGYQVLLKVGESSGSTGSQFNLGGHSSIFPSAQDQGGDLRFTQSDGSTELKYWVEDVTGSTPNRVAYVWIKEDADLGSSQDIYVYYGNSSATNSSNGFNTFNFFDNFDDGVINPLKWTTICSSGCNITSGVSSTMSESGGSLKQFDAPIAGSQGRAVATSTPIDTSGYATRRHSRRTDDGTFGNSDIAFGTGVTDASDNATTSPDINNNNNQNRVNFYAANKADGVLYNSDLTQNTWYRSEVQRISSTRVGAALWADDQSLIAATTTNLTSAVSNTEYPILRSGDGHDPETDWFLVRKFKETEPAYSSVASEETNSVSSAGAIQNITYAYDAVGNITTITDISSTTAAKTVSFAYDDLHRLVTASTTVASSTPYKQTYSYNALGSIYYKSDVGTTTYASTGYANSHAPTTVNATSYTYDNNGNTTAAGSLKYSWDYRNRMLSSGTGTATTTFAYDYQDQRVKKTLGSFVTLYPNKYFDTSTSTSVSTTTDYIYLGDTIIAEIEATSSGSGGGGGGGTSTSTPAYVQSNVAHGANSVAFSSPVTTGDLVVVGITIFSQTIASNAITDNKGNTYTKVAEAINGTDHAAIFYAKNVTGGSSFTVSSVPDGTLSIHEYSGISSWAAFDKAASSTGTSATPKSASITTATSSELYFGIAWSEGTGAWTAGSGYTLRQSETDNNNFERLGSEDAVIATASTTNSRFSITSSNAWAAAIASFKPATTTSGGGGGGGATSTATTTRYYHADQLNSTNVVTSDRGAVVQTLDYYPYGASRINQSTNGLNEKKQFIGQYADPETNLSYLNARYYNSTNGQFLSEDPVFWGNPSQQRLSDPQSMNSYSYANDNPIIGKDPTGRLGEFGARHVPNSLLGTHEFVYWAPQRPDLVNYGALGIPNGTKDFTIGFYDISGYLQPSVYYPGGNSNESNDYNSIFGKTSSKGTQIITGLSPEAEANAINSMASVVSSYNNQMVVYPSIVNLILGTGVNSNSAAHTLSKVAGLESQFNSFHPQGYPSGSQLYLPAGSYTASQVNSLTNLAAVFGNGASPTQLASVQNVISAFSTPQTIK